MKPFHHLSAATLLLLLASAAPVVAQAPIRATTTLHPDGGQTVMIVDPEKMQAEETRTDANKKVVSKVTYLLDERNQPLAGITYDGKGTMLFRATYKRDGQGRIDEETISSPAGQFLRRKVYTYGADGKVTNMTEYDAAGNPVQYARKPTGPAYPSRGKPDNKRSR